MKRITLLFCCLAHFVTLLAQTYPGRITSNSTTSQQPQLYLRNSGSVMQGQQYSYIFSNMANGILFQANTSGIDANTANGDMVITSSGNIGIKTKAPLDNAALTIKGKTGIEWKMLALDGNTDDWFMGSFGGGGFFVAKDNFASSNSKFVISSEGDVGIGTISPSSKIQVTDDSGTLYFGRPGTEMNNRLTLDASSGYENQIYFRMAEGRIFSGNTKITMGTSTFANDLVILPHSGNVGIGTSVPDEKLTVKGTIHSEEVKVDLSVPGPDYVFEEDYNLRSLAETEDYIKAHKHLPEIPSAKEMEADGVQLGEMNMLLLKKIEELTLHTIKQQKLIEEQGKMIEEQGKMIQNLKNQIEK